MRARLLVLLLALAACGPDRPGFELSAELVTPTDIELTWHGGPDNAVANVVEFATDPSGPYTVLEFLAPERTSFEHPDLMPSTPFYYRVRSVHGPASPAVEVTMPEEPRPRGRVAPAGVSFSDARTVPVSSPFSGDRVVSTAVPGGPRSGDPALSGDGVGLVSASASSLSDGRVGLVGASGGLSPDGRAGSLLDGRRASVTSFGRSPSGARSGSTTMPHGLPADDRAVLGGARSGGRAAPLPDDWAEPVTVPDERARPSGLGGPTNLTAAVVAPDGVRFTWTDNAAVEVGYLLEARPAGASEYRVVAVVDADVNAFGLVTLPSERVASYRVRAYEFGSASTVAHRTTGIS